MQNFNHIQSIFFMDYLILCVHQREVVKLVDYVMNFLILIIIFLYFCIFMYFYCFSKIKIRWFNLINICFNLLIQDIMSVYLFLFTIIITIILIKSIKSKN